MHKREKGKIIYFFGDLRYSRGKGQGLTSNQIFQRMNAVNGEDHLINLEVIIIIIKVITNQFNNNV